MITTNHSDWLPSRFKSFTYFKHYKPSPTENAYLDDWACSKTLQTSLPFNLVCNSFQLKVLNIIQCITFASWAFFPTTLFKKTEVCLLLLDVLPSGFKSNRTHLGSDAGVLKMWHQSCMCLFCHLQWFCMILTEILDEYK